MTNPTLTEKDVAEIAGKLAHAEKVILGKLARNEKLGLACRSQDRARQLLRRHGLIAYCGKPLRWQISDKGLAVRNHLISTPNMPKGDRA